MSVTPCSHGVFMHLIMLSQCFVQDPMLCQSTDKPLPPLQTPSPKHARHVLCIQQPTKPSALCCANTIEYKAERCRSRTAPLAVDGYTTPLPPDSLGMLDRCSRFLTKLGKAPGLIYDHQQER